MREVQEWIEAQLELRGIPSRFIPPHVSGGVLYGRGTSDMKSELVAMRLASVIHRDLGGDGHVRPVYVPDEKSGAQTAGAVTVEVTVTGTPAHVGLHYTGHSASKRRNQ